ncbi:MAG: hypothetical protein Greene07144_1025, partial [Parcubacteria group bacterium Greene0714_4]
SYLGTYCARINEIILNGFLTMP